MEKCLLCDDDKDESEITKLKCNHIFCWICLETYFKKNLDSKIKCPTSSCHEIFRDDQIRKVLCSEDIEIYESLCLEGLTKAHYCLLTQCRIPIFYQDPDVQFECSNCSLYNCIKCQAAHGFIGCKAYQSKSETNKIKICEQEMKRAESVLNNKKAIRSREMLLELDTVDLINNDSIFTCDFCCLVICKGEGVKLQNCGDLVCKKCLLNSIEKTTEIPAKCPSCQQSINDREIRTILSDQQFLIYQEKCQDFSKQFITHFQCQTPDCDAFYEISESLKEFTCGRCKGINCIKCKAVHSNETCEQYKIRLGKDSNLLAIEEKIKEKKLMRCPKCNNLIMKTRGCDAIQCSNCSTELCWIRQMERWGPGGHGDNSGGCKCTVGGKKCHIDCYGCTLHNEAIESENNSIVFPNLGGLILLRMILDIEAKLLKDMEKLNVLENPKESSYLREPKYIEESFNQTVSKDLPELKNATVLKDLPELKNATVLKDSQERNNLRAIKNLQESSHLKILKESNKSSCSLM